MIAGVPFFTLLQGMILDCLNPPVVILLLCALAFRCSSLFAQHLFPLVVSLCLAYGFISIVPSRVFLHSPGFLLYLWIPLLFLPLAWCKRKIYHSAPGHRPKLLPLILPIIALVNSVTILVVSSNHLVQSLPVFQGSVACLLACLFFLINPTDWLPCIVKKETPKFFCLLSFGLFLLGAGLWIYTAFNASIKEPPGSFVPRGIIFAQEWAELWNFTHLQTIIRESWLF
jgi:hypothetical protein